MISMLQNWKGTVELDGTKYSQIDEISTSDLTALQPLHIRLYPAQKKQEIGQEKQSYRVTVKKYMTEPASPTFDFMAKWNNNEPMPLRTMVGTVEKQTRGMVYMKLHGQGQFTVKCMRCGRTLTNKISKLYGVGPECINYIPAIQAFQLTQVEEIKRDLVNVTWEGWVIKSAILEQEEI